MANIPSAVSQDLNQQRTQQMLYEPNRLLKQGVWVYFLLLILEGALRKWFLPGLATPLLIIRDPIALWLILVAWQRGLLSSNLYMSGMVLIGIIGIFTAIFFGHGNLAIAVFGARILLIHFPFIFVIGKIFNREDVIKLGKIVLWLAIPMTVLIALQFYSPQSAWVNRGVGGDIKGAGFDGALGFFRPPGTFSFTNGNSLFYSLVSCFVFYFWFSPNNVNRLLLIAATICLLAAIPLSISRALFFQVCVTFIFVVFTISHKPQYLGRIVLVVCGVTMALFILSQTNFFQTATEAFSTRFENASKDEGGIEGTLLNRYLGHMIESILPAVDQPFFGKGLGLGTNVASALMTGNRKFLVAEEEWPRLIGELGPLMGLLVIFIRLSFCAKIALASYRMMHQGDLLPWILLSFGLLNIPQGQWAQPTALGFSTVTAGLILASFNIQRYK